MRWPVLICLLLGACSTPSGGFVAYITDITDRATLASDKAFCETVALAYKPGVDFGGILSAGAQGAANNAAEGVLSPYVPLVGAAGGVATASLQALGLNSQAQVKIYLRCLSNRGMKSGKYSVVDPNL